MSWRVVSCWGSETVGCGTEGEGGGETEGECEQELAVVCILKKQMKMRLHAWIQSYIQQKQKQQITALTNHDTLCHYCCSYLQ